MTLSNSTLQNLSTALTPEVISYIYSDDRFTDFLYDIVPDAITSTLGQIDEDLKYELACCIISQIELINRE